SAGITTSRVRLLCLLFTDALSDELVAKAANVFARQSVPFEHVAGDFNVYDRLPLGSHFSRAAYGRLAIPEVARHFAPRTLYLDADTLAIGDLEPLARARLECTVAAVQSRVIPTCGSPGGVRDWQRRG